MPTIRFSFTDEDIESISKRLAKKMTEALNEMQSQRRTEPLPVAPAPAEWLKLSDVRRMYQVSRPTLYRWIHKQGLPCHRVGSIVRIKASEVQDWVEQHPGTL